MDNPQPAEGPILNIVGDKVALGPHHRDLVPLYERWMNDFEVTRTLAMLRPHTREQETAWFERATTGATNSVGFAIYERATLRPIGNTSLMGIDHVARIAEFGIIIGVK